MYSDNCEDKPFSKGLPMSEIEVSVVMPCLNEARTVGICVKKALASLRAMKIQGEVIVADNGSVDGSPQIAEQAGARVISISAKGYGSALLGAIAAAHGQFVIMGDADDSYDFTQVKIFVDRLRSGDDLVIGNRFKGSILPGAMPWHHKYIGNPILTWMLNLFFRSGIGDAHCGLRAFRKASFDHVGLVASGMEFASEMIVKASLHSLKLSEVPIVLHPDGRGRRPHLRSFRDGWRHLRFLFLHCPLWLFLIPASIFLVFGFGLMIWLTPGLRVVEGIGLDVHTMILGSLCVILGYQTLWFGLLAKILGEHREVLPPDVAARAIARVLSIERGLFIGALLFVIGFSIDIWLALEWWSVSLGSLNVSQHVRQAIWGLSLMVLGVQTIYGSFFLSLISLWIPPRQVLKS